MSTAGEEPEAANEQAELDTARRYTEVNFVVEVHRRGRPWMSMYNAGRDEEAARDAYVSWCGSSQSSVRGGKLEIRLMRRTAVITDEVLDTTE